MSNDTRPLSINDGSAPVRKGKATGTSPGRMAGAHWPRRPVQKTYKGRLPVSGAKPAREDDAQ